MTFSWGHLVERAPLSTEIRQALDDAIGFKLGATRRCLGCNHKHREHPREMRILQLALDPRDGRNKNANYKMHVNDCLKAASEEVDSGGETIDLFARMLSFFVTFATKHFLPPHVEEVDLTQRAMASETDSFRNVFTQTVKATTSLKESTSKAREWRWRRGRMTWIWRRRRS